MSYQALNFGTVVNDGTGDTLPVAADKINDNFVEIYGLLGDGTSLSSGISATATVVTLTAPTISGVVGGTITSATITTLTGTTFNAGTLALAAGSITDSSGAISFGNENLTTTGSVTAASLDISGNVDIDGTLETDALTINGTTLAETISDTVGAMVSSNTETNITVTYDDADNTLDFVIGTLNQSTSGNAATATALETARTIGGTSFDGTANIAVALSATATALANARTIHGVSFDGTANIDLTEVVQDTVGAMFGSNTETGITATYQDSDGTIDLVIGTLNQDTTGNAATATALETARTIHGVSFDGTANIDLTEVVQDTVGAMFSSNTETGITVTYQDADGTVDFVIGTLNQDTTGSAATLTTARTIGGVSFDGSANINLPGVNTAGNQNTSGTAAVATVATTVTITDNESTNENNAIVFTAGGDVDGGNIGLESDGTLTYNPSTGKITATGFVGALTGDVTGDVTGNADTATALATARTIHGVSFDGTANIDLTEVVQDTVGAMFGSNTETGITVTYQDADGTIDLVVGTLNQDTTGTASKVTVTDSTANTNFPVTFHDESNALLDDTGALRYNPSTGTLLVPNLVVAGTTTQVDTVTMNAENAVIFEGATADDHETTLTIIDPTADRTQRLLNQSGFIPLLAAVTTTAITSTPEELNILDGATVVVGEINALDLGSTAVGTAIASKAVILDSNKDYTGIRNFTVSGELDAATGDFSGDVDVDGTLEADAITVNGTALNEFISDTVGAMVGSNTETGITVTYQDADNTIDFALAAAQTTITSLLATDIKIGEDDQTKIDFETADEIHFYAANAHQIKLVDGALVPATDNDVDLGTSSAEFKDAYFDGTVTADAFAGPISGDLTGTLQTAAQANVTSLGTLTALTVDNIIINGTNIGHTSDTDSIAIASDGVVTFSQAPVFPDGSIAVADLDIDGATDIGAALVDADLLIVDDGAGGTNRKTTMARIKTYINASASGSVNADDVAGGDAAVLLTTSSGNITIDAAANDSDIIFKGTDGGADTTFLTIDGSAAGEATFNAGIVIADDGNIGSASDKDAIAIASNGVVTFSQIPVMPANSIDSDEYIDGSIDTAHIADNQITLAKMAGLARGKIIVGDASGDPSALAAGSNGQVLASDGTDLAFVDISVSSLAADNLTSGDAAVLLTTSSGNITIDAAANDSDIIFKGTDGGSDLVFATIDGSAAGKTTFNDEIVSGAVITSGAGLVIADAGTIGSASDTDAIAIGSDGDVTLTQDLELQHDGAILSFGANDEVTVTHVHNTGLLLNAAMVVQFRDSAINIGSPADGDLDINADDEIELNSTLIDVNGNLDVSGTIVGASTLSATTGTFSGILKTDDATEATSTTDGSLQTDGGLSVVKDIVAGDDIKLLSDAAVVAFGANSEITLTHVHDVGLTITNTINGTDNRPTVLQLKSEEDAIVADDVIASIEMAAGDSDGTDGATVAAGIHAIAEDTFSASANKTKLVFTTGVSETAASSATAKATLSSIGDFTVAGDLIIKDGGTIGSASDLDAIAIAADGVVTMNQIPVFSAGINVSGGSIAGTLSTAAQGNITSLGTLTTLTVDNVVINGATIGHGDDTDLMTVADGILTVAGEVSLTTLDIGGTNVTSTAAELNALDGITAVVGELNALDLGSTAVGNAIASKAVILDSNKDYTGVRNFTLSGELDAGSLDVSGNVDIDGTLEADAITVNGTALAEFISDTAGAMVSSNTETGISVTYQDGDNTIDFALAAAQTTITSLLATDIKIGEDDQTKIDFETADEIHFYANNANEMIVQANVVAPGADDGTALGDANQRWSDLFLASGAVVNFDNGDVTATHSSNTLTIAGGTLATAALTTSTIVASGIIKTDDSTEATSTTDGSLQTDGGLSVAKDIVAGDDIKLLSDAAVIHFGTNSEITATHVHNVGLTLTHTATGDNTPMVLQLKSEEDAIIANEVIGSLEFAAGDSDGTDGATVAAGIHAIAEGTFSASANATKLVFTTGVSETAASSATAKMTLSSAGLLTIADDFVIKDGGTIGVASDADSITIASDGVVTFSQEIVAPSLDISGNVDIDGTLEADAITVNGTALAETISDTVGAMVGSNTETGIAVTYQDGDNTIDFAINAAQTTITSLLATDIKIGEDDQTKIDFETADEIHFYAANAHQIKLVDGALVPVTDDDVDLGTSSLEFKDAFFDGTVTSDAFAGPLTGDVTGTSSKVTVTNSTANTNFPVVFHDESNALLDDTGALRYNPSSGTLLVPNLVVAGTTTQVDTVTMNAENAVVFEGATADDHETTLTIIDPTGDRTINLPNVSGTIPVLAAASTTQITSTPAELNILDGATVVVGEINALDLGSTAVGNAIASKAVILDSNKDYTGMRNLTISGEIDAATGDFSGAVDVAGATTTAAITASGIIKTDDATEATSTTDGSLQTDGGLSVVKDAVFGDDIKLLSDAAVAAFGANGDVTLTHVHNTGLLLNAAMVVQFRDSAINIGSPADGDLDINADDEIELNSTLIDVNGNLDVSGTIVGASTLSATTGTFSGILKTDDATEATSTTDGSLQTDGGLSVVKDIVAGDDIKLLSDAAVIHFGTNSEITATHVHNVGLTLTHTATGDNTPMVLQLKSEEDAIVANEVIASLEFAAGDSDGTDGATVAAGIHAIAEDTFSASANATKLVFTTGVSETAASSATAKMTLSSAGLLTIADDLVIKDGGTIGVASDADSIAIASNGVVTFSQAPVFPDGSIAVADLDIDGATDIGAAIVDADLFIIDDGAGGTNRKTTAARIKTYTNAGVSSAADDISAGDAAVTITTSSGNITIDAAANDSDIILKGTDGGADTDFLTIDGSAAGKATFNNEIVSGAVITSGAGLVIADAGTIGSASDTDAIAIGSDGDVTLTQDLELQHDGAILSFGANDEVTLTHVHNDGLLLNADMQLQFRDSAINIRSDADGDLDINADDEIELNSTLIDINGAVDISGATTVGGILKTDDATEATSTTDGSLQTDGGLSVVKDAVFGDDVKLLSDAAVISFGANSEITATHVHNVGLTLTHTATGANTPMVLELKSEEDAITSANIIGALHFSAGDSDGTDGATVAAAITAEAEGTFSASANATKLVFTTGVSETASRVGGVANAKMTLASDGDLTLAGTVTTTGIILGGTTVTSTGAELNILDGVTSTAAELNALDGITAVVGELNALDLGSTAVGNAIASKAVILDSNKDYTGIRNFTIDGDLDVGDDLKLTSDAAVAAFGADGDVTLTHVHNTGLLLNSTMAIQFNDSSQYINAPSASTLHIRATDEIELTATLFDLNGNLDVSGTIVGAGAITGGGLLTTGGNIVIPNTGNIGSAGDTDAIAIAANGVVTFSQAPVFPDGSIAVVDLDIDGATDIGAAIVDADLFIIDDGAGGTNRKTTAARIKTYIDAAATPKQILIKNAAGTVLLSRVGHAATGGTDVEVQNSAGTALLSLTGPFSNAEVAV